MTICGGRMDDHTERSKYGTEPKCIQQEGSDPDRSSIIIFSIASQFDES